MRAIVIGLGLIVSQHIQAQDTTWSLQQCIDHALEKNITIQQSSLQGEILDNNLLQSQLSRLPNLNASANHNYNIGRSIDPFSNTFSNTTIQSNALSVSSGMMVYGGNQLNNTVKRNRLATQSNDAAIELAKNQVALQVASIYLQIIQAEENLKLTEAQVELTRSQLDRMKKLVESGSANLGSQLNLEAQLANDKLQVTQAQNTIQMAYNAMINTLQLPLDTPFEIDAVTISELPAMPMETLASIYQLSTTHLPEIRQAELNLRSAQVGEKIAQASLLPRLTAYWNMSTIYSESGKLYTLTGYDLSTLPIGQTESGNEFVYGYDPQFTTQVKPFEQQLNDNLGNSVGLSLSIPLFNGFQNKAAVENARLNTKISKLQQTNVHNQLRSDLTTAYTNLKTANSRYNAALLNVEAQRLNYEYQDKRYESGMVNLVDLNTAKTLYFQAQLQLVSAKYEYVFRNLIIEFYKGNELKL